MPIYEFYSPDSHRIYSFFARRMLKVGEVPICPDNPSHKMEKIVSNFAFTGKAKERMKNKVTEEGSKMDPRMERKLMKMAADFPRMDEKNSDSRMIGRMMRGMVEVSGQKIPREMGEMLQRLEKGENPDKLEKEYGDVMEKMEEIGEVGEKGKDWRMRVCRRRLPCRDPKLHELEDYLQFSNENLGSVRQKA
jgi:hypothetical protein